MADHGYRVRVASPADAAVVASLLHDFNAEFDAESPGVEVIAPRLTSLLAGDQTAAIVAEDPAAKTTVGLGLVTFRPNVWYDGEVALLDELYVVPDLRGQGIGTSIISALFTMARERGVSLIEVNVDEPDVDAQRFYERHGFNTVEPDTGERAFYFHRELNRPES